MSKQALDALGLAITNAGYTWTPEMRSAYEKGIRESEWVGLTVDEARKFYEKYTNREELIYAIDEFLEEKNGG